MNERSLSARWRKSDVVRVLGVATWPGESQEPSLLRWLHGSLESWLLAMLILENRTGRSGPAKESRLTRSFPSPSEACEPCIDLLPLCTEPRFSSRSNMASLIIGVFSPSVPIRAAARTSDEPQSRGGSKSCWETSIQHYNRLTIRTTEKGEDTEWAKRHSRAVTFT